MKINTEKTFKNTLKTRCVFDLYSMILCIKYCLNVFKTPFRLTFSLKITKSVQHNNM